MPTRSEIRANRQRWIDFLMAPEREKARGSLEYADFPEQRCCLGHACAVLGAERIAAPGVVEYEGEDAYAPESIVDALGLWDKHGSVRMGTEQLSFEPNPRGYNSLADINDGYDGSFYSFKEALFNATPQVIGAYLLTVIEGGPDTPFQPLTDYQE